MKKVYMDNAATSFPKPETVSKAVYHYMTECGCNINRGCYGEAYKVEEIVLETRELLCELFGGDDPRNVIFTGNVTESLNVILKGFLKKGDHVIVSSMEHNAVMRPLVQLQKTGISFSRIPCNEKGELMIECIETLFRDHTKAIVMTHASNVCGTILDLKTVGKIAKEHQVRLIVDCAQTAGIISINMEEMNIDALAFTGHKGLLGPQGIGGFLLRNGMEKDIEPLISGGTGSISHTEEVPEFMPDRFEPGTRNIPGIIGLHQGLLWIKETGIDSIREKEAALLSVFMKRIRHLEEKGLIQIIGKQDNHERTGVVSLQTMKMDIADAAYRLDEKYGIMTRVGLHCAPSAHKTLGTYPTGTIRFSFGYFNTIEEVEYAARALEEICYGI